MRAIPVVVFVFGAQLGVAQSWRAIGNGTVGPTGIQTLYGDDVSDRLLAGGTFMRIRNEEDTVLGMGQAKWNGSRWDSLAHRIQQIGGVNSTQQTYWFTRFQGQLYACGGFGFETEPGVWNRHLARLNEQSLQWGALECLNTGTEGMSTWVPKEPQGTLYATGYSGTVCGYPVACVFRYDGSAFHIWEPFEQIPPESDNYVGTVFDFQGKTYMSGLFQNPNEEGSLSFARFNGANWEEVPGWNTTSGIKEISIRDNVLYVAGGFRTATGGPGNLVAAFDGETWDDLGGGLLYTAAPFSSVVNALQWHHDDLYACGLFSTAGGVVADGIAKWNGRQWCVPPGSFHGPVNSIAMLLDMTVWRDSLYVCGGFNSIDGEPFGQVAQWIGGDTVAECSAPVGMAETTTTAAGLLVHSTGMYTFVVSYANSASWRLTVLDALGKEVHTQRATTTELMLDLGAQAPGIYLLRATNAAGEVRTAKLLRP